MAFINNVPGSQPPPDLQNLVGTVTISSSNHNVALQTNGYLLANAQVGLSSVNVFMSSAAQIPAYMPFVVMTGSGGSPLTVSAKPTISTASILLLSNTLLYLYNHTSHDITLQDDNNLAGSKLMLKNRANLTIPSQTMVQFMFLKNDNFWKQITDPI